MDYQLFDRLQQLTPGSDKYRRILSMFERHTLSGVMARLLTEEDPELRTALETGLHEILSSPEND